LRIKKGKGGAGQSENGGRRTGDKMSPLPDREREEKISPPLSPASKEGVAPPCLDAPQRGEALWGG